MSVNQGKLYDSQYDDAVFETQGLPDPKITNGKEIFGKKILSLGCGMGTDLWWLSRDNDVFGLDLSQKAILIARKHGLKAKVGDVTKKLPYKAQSFDIVVLKDILEHILDPMALLLEARRVVRSRGTIVVSLPNHFWWWFRIRILFGRNLLWKTLQHDHTKDQHEWDYMHIRFFTWVGLQDFIKTAGLKVGREFWDFGTLAHYSDPEMFYPVLKEKKKKSKSAKIFLNFIYPLYLIFDFFVPKQLRAYIVAINPGLLCSGFYLHLKK